MTDQLDGAVLGIVEAAQENTLTVGLVRARAADRLGCDVLQGQARQALARLLEAGAITTSTVADRFIYLDMVTP